MNRDVSIEALKIILSDIYVLSVMSQNAHWNMEGPSFFSLHQLFESQYKELTVFIDDLAERIRALGDYVPARMQDFHEMSRLDEALDLKEELVALSTLTNAYQKLSILLQEHITEIEPNQDVVTCDMLTSLLAHVDKQTWLLKSHF
jgi:starvation-inducible DNA-binding protein